MQNVNYKISLKTSVIPVRGTWESCHRTKLNCG